MMDKEKEKCPFLVWLRVNRIDISKYPPILLKLAWTEKCPLIRWVDSTVGLLEFFMGDYGFWG